MVGGVGDEQENMNNYSIKKYKFNRFSGIRGWEFPWGVVGEMANIRQLLQNFGNMGFILIVGNVYYKKRGRPY